MRNFVLLSAVLSFSAPFGVSAQEYDRSFSSEVSEQVSEHQHTCENRIAEEWAKPDIADENYTKLNLTFALNRETNGQETVVFHGTAYNRFLQLEREAIITCRVGNEPYFISFRIDR